MSDGTYATGAGGAGGTASSDQSGMVESAKHEAVDLKDTATDAAKDVAGTAKDEAASVAHETKAQAVDLFHQTRRELSDQAATQQQRAAAGLSALSDELGSMARNSDGSGIAADLVQRVSDRASSAAAWLDSRDPSGVLDDVRSFARRRPVVFIGAAVVAGIVAGRLTRALIANAQDDAPTGASGSPARASGARPVAAPAEFAVATPTEYDADESPLYTESATRFHGTGGEGTHERSDTF